jgi:hypothetical protein
MITTAHRPSPVTSATADDRLRIVESAGRTVWLRLWGSNDELQVVPLNITEVGDDVDAISRGDGVIGYIRRVDPVFVALVGARLDRAEECGQSLLWDKAATRLLEETDSSGTPS